MSDIRPVVGTIRGSLHSPDLTMDDRLRRAAEAYADACQRANDRLGRCADSLSHGMRSEALRLAEMTPDLLELVTDLDFPERPDWDERVLMNDLPLPAPLDRRAVEILNRAYAEEQSLGDLLKHFRLLALARSPLRERLATLRVLARAEATNPVWVQDVASYETARFDEMRAEVRSLRSKQNWSLVQQMCADVESKDWATVPPLDLMEEVNREFYKQGRTDATARVAAFQKQADDAVAAFDIERCRRVRQSVERLCTERSISLADPIFRRLNAAFAWLTEQDRLAKQAADFDRACQDMTEVMDADVEGDELDSLHAAAVRFRMPIPSQLAERYRSKRGIQRRGKILTTIFFICATLTFFGIIGGIVLWMIFR